MIPFDSPENITKSNISYPLIRTRGCANQGVRNVRFSDFFRGIKREYWEEKRYKCRNNSQGYLNEVRHTFKDNPYERPAKLFNFFVNFYNFTIRFVASVNIDFHKILTTDTK